MKAIQSASAMNLNDVLDKLQELRAEGGGEAMAPDAKPKRAVPPKKKAAVSKAKAKPTTTTAPTDMAKMWATMMACLGAFTKSYFTGAYPLLLENGVMTIGFPEPSSSQMELADNKETNKVLIQSIEKMGQEVREIRYTIADRPADWVVASAEKTATDDATSDAAPTKPPEGPVDMEQFKNDPLIQKALEVFKGQIVDVRT